MPPRKFAPEANLPARLQARIDAWDEAPPKWQHEVYGPLISYLSIRFPPTHFLVEPRALLREELATPEQDPIDIVNEGSCGDSEKEGSISKEEHMDIDEDSDESIDSHGM